MSDDPWDSPTAKAWVRSVIEDMVPKMQASKAAMHIVPPTDMIDAKFCVELGAAIMLGKPIIAIVMGDGRPVPEKLRLVADEIVVLEEGVDAQAADKVAQALNRVITR